MMENSIVLTGTIIKEYLDAYGITQKDLAARTGISEKHISNVLSGHARLTEEFALKLEKVMPEVSASYWLNYEAKYREQLARQKELYHIGAEKDLKEIAKKFRFNEVFKGLGMSLTEQAVEMLKMLGISDFSNFDRAYEGLNTEFMKDGGEKEAITVWLRLCEEEIEIQNANLDDIPYLKAELEKNIARFKRIANNTDLDASIKSCRKLANSLGIYFVICEAVSGSKVRGALKQYRGHPAIFISRRFKKHDYVWFAIVHELAHLLLHYQKNDIILSYNEEVIDAREKENEANAFTRDFFINPVAYDTFVAKGDFNAAAVRKFAASQDVVPAIVIGRLQHDKHISYDKLERLR